ncbi:MAG: hypothetical protein IJ608_13825 [Lachnospiraceae bacterium]|nr:hypothetical protein [Lachnospiraceae bacterium]
MISGVFADTVLGLPETDPKRDNYKLVGWAGTADATEANVTSTTKVSYLFTNTTKVEFKIEF